MLLKTVWYADNRLFSQRIANHFIARNATSILPPPTAAKRILPIISYADPFNGINEKVIAAPNLLNELRDGVNDNSSLKDVIIRHNFTANIDRYKHLKKHRVLMIDDTVINDQKATSFLSPIMPVTNDADQFIELNEIIVDAPNYTNEMVTREGVNDSSNLEDVIKKRNYIIGRYKILKDTNYQYICGLYNKARNIFMFLKYIIVIIGVYLIFKLIL